jgi:Raf kinase inhibitor-like YbhB/YbcL family protein
MRTILSIKVFSFLIVGSGLALGLLSCSSTPSATATPPPAAATDTPIEPTPTAMNTPTVEIVPWALTSPAFAANQTIPARHACHGENLSPPLDWNQPPPGTQSLALILDDPDAVDVVGYVYDHWLVFNLPPETLGLPEGIGRGSDLPEGSAQGMNSAFNRRYDGPCPPDGQTHDYVFTLYALDTVLDVDAGAKKEELLAVMEGHMLTTTQLVGPYTSP